MRFEGEFRVPGQPEQVLEGFADVERMVKCMPGAGIEGRDQEGNYLGTMLVAFGPKKIKFKGKVTCSVDPPASSGRLHVRGAADMRAAARIEVHVQYTVRADPTAESPTSIVSLTSDAELGGVLADFGRTGGIAVTQALMEMFAQRVAEEFSSEQRRTDSDADASSQTTQDASRPQPSALSVRLLLWAVLKGKLSFVADWMKRLRTRN